MNARNWKTLALFAGLIGICVVGRLLPHPPNFTPVAATALFAGFIFRRWWVALLMPIAAMLASDLFIGFHQPGVMIAVYLSLLFPLVWRSRLRQRVSAPRVGLFAGSASVVFFLGSNLGVWWFGGMYARTGEGLTACYLAALPFFKYTLMGDLAWSAMLFGLWALVTHTRRAEARLKPIAA